VRACFGVQPGIDMLRVRWKSFPPPPRPFPPARFFCKRLNRWERRWLTSRPVTCNFIRSGAGWRGIIASVLFDISVKWESTVVLDEIFIRLSRWGGASAFMLWLQPRSSSYVQFHLVLLNNNSWGGSRIFWCWFWSVRYSVDLTSTLSAVVKIARVCRYRFLRWLDLWS